MAATDSIRQSMPCRPDVLIELLADTLVLVNDNGSQQSACMVQVEKHETK